jgi:serine/threonine protein kinase
MEIMNPEHTAFSPYLGLQPYSEADQDYFFGRERDSRIISSNIYAAPLTVLYGASGVGKSSVLRAGVIPLMRVSPRTTVVIFDAWADPAILNTLKSRCMEATAAKIGSMEFEIDLSLPLDEFLKQAIEASGDTLVIILDQFEEYFLYHPEAEKVNQYDSEFARAINHQEIDVSFLISLREDSLSKLDRFRARIPNLFSNILRLRHLDASSARAAMHKPLEVFSQHHPDQPRIAIEDDLMEELIQQIQVDKLIFAQGGLGVIEEPKANADLDIRIEAPFLQLALMRLWNEEITQGSQVLRLATLKALGGAESIVQSHMDTALKTLSLEEQEIAANIFRYLVTPSGTKIAYTVEDLEYYVEAARSLQTVLKKLTEGDVRILRSFSLPGDSESLRFEIFHDVLAQSILDWRARYEDGKQLLRVFQLLVEKDDHEQALKSYQDMVQRTPQQAFFPDRYEVRKILGQSSFGVSYGVFDRDEDRFFTATILEKSLAIQEEALVQFASLMKNLSHPRISRFFGFDHYNDHTYMLTEYIEGQILRERLRQDIHIDYLEAMKISQETAEALEEGHRQGVPHLNLQTSNIVLGPTGVKLVNYGFSRLASPSHIPTRLTNDHSDDYLAPEQLSGKEGNERSDIYALGTILYEMLTGHPPGVGRFRYPSEVNIEVPDAVDVLIDHAREKSPDKRFASVGQMLAEIQRISQSSIKGHPNQYVRFGLAWVSKRYDHITSGKWLAFLLIGLVLLLFISLNILTESNQVRLLARLILPLIFNSLIVSILFDWVIRTIARSNGLGSIIRPGSGMGAILGLLLTLHMQSLVSLEVIAETSEILSIFAAMLTLVLFGAGLSLGIILVGARIAERLFRSYTTGFYWSFVMIVIIELILTILRQPQGLIE